MTLTRSARLTAGWLRRQWSTLLVILLALSVSVLALVNDGLDAADVHLNEGAVYVQNQNLGMVGNLNYQIDELAAATVIGDTAATLLQEGPTVLINNTGSSTLQIYDPATNSLSTPVNPPAQALMSLNEGILAVTNPENGKVWFDEVDRLARSDFRGDAALDLGDWGQAVVTTSGSVIGMNVQDSTIVRPDGSTVDIPFQVDNSAPTAQLSAVGERAVVLDRTSQQIWVEGDRRPVEISSGTTAQLAPPMADSSAAGRGGSVVYATQAGLNTIQGGAPQSLSGRMEATPTPPVTVGDCAYGAFVDRVVKVCGGGEPQILDIPELPAAANLEFHVNRGNVVLQDATSGIVWLVDKGMKIVNNWERVAPEQQRQTDDPNPPDDRTTLPDRSGPNRPPIAIDDPNLGARVGRSTVLPILDNDSDDDGDIITITEVTALNGASLELTGAGTGLQITMPDDASGNYQFTYTIVDGRGGSASATATVRALPADQQVANDKPVNIRPAETTVVASGTTISKRVLLTWRDPDGDDLVLVNATPEDPESEDEVSFAPDGTITFRDVGKTTGLKRVRVWVSDGVTVTEGFVQLEVREREGAPPVANGDFVSTTVNRDVLVSPLANDEGNNLVLTEVEQPVGDYSIVPNYPEGTFRFRAATAGTYYVVYKVNNGIVASGVVRIDVLSETTDNHAPVAVRDTALVPFGGSVAIDPLLNDTDADNDVLVVQSVTQHPAVDVVLTERHLMTISMRHHSETPIPLTYWVSDGRQSVRGTIMVFPAPPATNSAPRPANDAVTVRAGATVSVPVLDNDVSPVGLPLTVAGLPGNPLGDRAWIDGDKVRISIPPGTPATTIPVNYEVSDGSSTPQSATIAVTVVSADAQNEAPTPQVVEARVLSNSVTRIPIKLAGVDPNGDAVRLLGLGSGPSLGRIIEVGDGFLRYESYPDSRGTDSFRYQVIDAYGAIGTGEIRIGVAPPSDDNQGPTGVPDEITVRPGRTVNLPVLVNDFDIDGDQFRFRDDQAVDMGFPAEIVDGQFVSFTAPTEPGTYSGSYSLIDQRGEPGQGAITVIVDEEAPLQAPTAVDDQLSVNDVMGQEWVEVDVLDNDYDLDGNLCDLRLSLSPVAEDDPMEATVTPDNKLSVKVTDAMQQIRYTITDADQNTAQALALVPGRDDSVPVLADPGAANEVVAGQLFTINFDTMVRGSTQERQVRLTSPDTVRATKGLVTIRPEGIDFQADVSYAGPASVVFEVVDDIDPADPSARRAFISVPITVLPAEEGSGAANNEQVGNQPPQGPRNIALEVGAGEPDQEFSLRERFVDPEGDNFSFQSWTASGSGVDWSTSVGGDIITARGGLTSRGANVTLEGRVVDAQGAYVDVSVSITVIGSTRPLPMAQTDVVDDANAGQARSVPVLDNDRSFLVTDESLEVLSASVVAGSGTASVSGQNVEVTPAEDFVGAMTVRYTIVDATKDAERQVDGAIQLTVRARPSRPGTPTIEEEGNHEVTIKWTSNSANGMPVTGRTVIASGSDGSSVNFTGCATNTCTVTGLTNNIGYTFSVTETNELGASEASNPSAVGTPDVKPPQLSPATLVFPGPNMPGRLDLSWTAPVFDGSPITSYTITAADGSVPAVSVPGSTTSYSFAGLTNYKGYQFVVTATNNKGTSDPSAPSNAEHPSGPPPAAPAPTAGDTDDPNGSQLNVSWSLPAEQGDPFTAQLIVLSGGNQVATMPIAPGQTSATVGGLARRQNYRAVVRITTRGGVTDSPPSNQVFTTAAPTDVANGHLAANTANTVTFSLAGNEGLDWEYALVTLQFNGASQSAQRVSPGGSASFTANRYDGTYSVVTQPCASGPSGPKCGANTAVGGSVRAFGVPQLADSRVRGIESGQIVVATSGTVQANGTPGQQVSYSIGGGSYTDYGGGDVRIPTNGHDTTVTFRVCDTGHANNCSTTSPIAVPAPMKASVSGREVSVTITDRPERNWSCWVGGQSFDPKGGPYTPNLTGTVEVRCVLAPSTTHIAEVRIG